MNGLFLHGRSLQGGPVESFSGFELRVLECALEGFHVLVRHPDVRQGGDSTPIADDLRHLRQVFVDEDNIYLEVRRDLEDEFDPRLRASVLGYPRLENGRILAGGDAVAVVQSTEGIAQVIGPASANESTP